MLSDTSAVGIDFGTSNSAVATPSTNGVERIVLERTEAGDRTEMPSAMFVTAGSHEILFGRAAFAPYVAGEDGRFMRGLKSLLGSSLLTERTAVSGRFYRFDEIVGLYIAALKSRAEAQLGREVTAVVMGRPVAFVDGNGAADAQAQNDSERIVRAQGFEHVAFELEPIAAAYDHEASLEVEELALVADIGGGTADFCLMRLGPDARRRDDRTGDILATAGVHIGGTDYDRELSLAHAMPVLGRGTGMKGDAFSRRALPMPNGPFVDLATWHRIPFLYTREARAMHAQLLDRAERPDLFDRFDAIVEDHRGHELAIAVEEAKIAVSDTGAASLDVVGLTEVPLDAERVSACTAALTSRVAACLRAMLADAGVTPNRVDRLIWMGGGSQFPPLRHAIRALVPDAGTVDRDLLGAVSAGLAVKAERLFG